MCWPWSRPSSAAPLPSPARRRAAPPVDDTAPAVFACSTCGRTDLPEAGDWDPPICLECDAAINNDADEEAGWYDGG